MIDSLDTAAALVVLFGWCVLLAVPWQPWRMRERLTLGASSSIHPQLHDVTVVIPARNEAAHIAEVVSSVRAADAELRIIVVDDESTDATATAAAAAGAKVVRGAPCPRDWTGKLWAVHQGLAGVTTPYVLLLDADVVIQPGLIGALKAKLSRECVDLASLMVRLRLSTFWEKFLLPPFVYFFKLLYPFALSNSTRPSVAAAAGGCMLVRRQALAAVDDMAVLRGALIDDCALARALKDRGFKTWVGVTRHAQSLRAYARYADVRDMVSRNAFTQLGYSPVLLVGCTLLMTVFFAGPVGWLLFGSPTTVWIGLATLMVIAISYVPTLNYYHLSLLWALLLPAAALLYVAMTWYSAVRHWRGVRSVWRDRIYETREET